MVNKNLTRWEQPGSGFKPIFAITIWHETFWGNLQFGLAWVNKLMTTTIWPSLNAFIFSLICVKIQGNILRSTCYEYEEQLSYKYYSFKLFKIFSAFYFDSVSFIHINLYPTSLDISCDHKLFERIYIFLLVVYQGSSDLALETAVLRKRSSQLISVRVIVW